jgi:hypothetical protein
VPIFALLRRAILPTRTARVGIAPAQDLLMKKSGLRNAHPTDNMTGTL